MLLRNKILALLVPSVVLIGFWPSGTRASDIGVSQNFFVNTEYDRTGRTQLTATPRWTGEHAQYFVEDTYWQTLDYNQQTNLSFQVEQLLQEFDQRIYPIETGFWGSEPNPGVDNDPRLVIVLSDLVDTAGGYFNTNNEFPRRLAIQSNEREMIVVNVRALKDERHSFVFLAHEFQHLISFYQRNFVRNLDDDVWLNEMRSEYSVELLGYNNPYSNSSLQLRLANWLADPTDSLTEWKNKASDYAQITFFSQYLAEQFGPTVLRDTLRGTSTGMMALSNALSASGSKLTASDVFMRWAVVNLVDDVELESWSGYRNENIRRALPVASTRTLNNLGDGGEYVFQENFSDWQAKWLELGNLVSGNNNILQLDLSGNQLADFRLAAVLYKNNQPSAIKFYNLINLATPSIFIKLDSGVNKVVLIPAKFSKQKGFTDNDMTTRLTLRAKRVGDISLITPEEATSPSVVDVVSGNNLIDGSLIRALGDSKVYLYQNGYRRWIRSEEIFRFYNWSFAQVIDLDQARLEKIPESNLIRLTEDKKVYQLDALGKHWLRMSGEKFIASGRNFSAVFIVNKNEFNFYKLSTYFF